MARFLIAVEIHQYDKKTRTVYDMTYGGGSRGARTCLGLLMSDYFDALYGENILDTAYKERLSHPQNYKLAEYFKGNDLSQFEQENGELDMQEIMATHDSEDGAIYLQVSLDDYGKTFKGRVRFYRGTTDREAPCKKIDMAHYFTLFKEEADIAPMLLGFQFEGIKVD